MSNKREESTLALLSDYVWGKEPNNYDEIKEELERRKINLKKLEGEIGDIVKRYSGI